MQAINPVGLKESIRRLAEVYPIDRAQLDAGLERLFFDAYAEVVLLRDGLEITIGGVDRRQQLITCAKAVGVCGDTIGLFAAFSERFPDRMGYLKLGFGPRPSAPTMHCGAIVRWRDIVAFIADQPAFAAGAEQIEALREPESICHLVAFQAAPDGPIPMMKIYWLLDQLAEGTPSPMLAAVRLSAGHIRPESKRYRMSARWEDARIDLHWNKLVTAAQAEFPPDAFLSISDLVINSKIIEQKVYVMVQDYRAAPDGAQTAWNLYYQEGLQYLHWQDFPRAKAAFSNAITFQPTHAHAINNRGFCSLIEGDLHAALRDFEQAIALDRDISPANRDHTRALLTTAPLFAHD
jgi:hypothetical protein